MQITYCCIVNCRFWVPNMLADRDLDIPSNLNGLNRLKMRLSTLKEKILLENR